MLELLLLLVFALPFTVELLHDPSPGLTRTVTSSRQTECRVLSREEVEARNKAQIVEAVNEDEVSGTYLHCEQRIFSAGERHARDEEVLARLSQDSARIAASAIEQFPNSKWVVSVHYPVLVLKDKIEKATVVSLKEKQALVYAKHAFHSKTAFPIDAELASKLNCQRHYSLEDGYTLLEVVLADARETQLHAGVCAKGGWKWLL